VRRGDDAALVAEHGPRPLARVVLGALWRDCVEPAVGQGQLPRQRLEVDLELVDNEQEGGLRHGCRLRVDDAGVLALGGLCVLVVATAGLAASVAGGAVFVALAAALVLEV
jgi:hypothetical protein